MLCHQFFHHEKRSSAYVRPLSSSCRQKFDSVDDTTSYTQLFSIVLRTLTSERRVSHLAPGWLPGWRTATTFERRKQKAKEVGGARNKNDVRERMGWRTNRRGATRSRASARNRESDGGCILDEGTTAERMTIRISVVVRAARVFFFTDTPGWRRNHWLNPGADPFFLSRWPVPLFFLDLPDSPLPRESRMRELFGNSYTFVLLPHRLRITGITWLQLIHIKTILLPRSIYRVF